MPRLPQQSPDRLSEVAKIGALCLASRAVFAAVLLPWFLIGGASKLGGWTISLGPTVGEIPLALGAYYAWLPELIDPASPPPDFPLSLQLFVAAMVGMELILPSLIMIGWKTRLAAILLVLHQAGFLILSGAWTEAGSAFDASPFDMLPDQMLLWMMLLAPLVLFGSGPISIDAALRWRRRIP